jgi:hypothetical protein
MSSSTPLYPPQNAMSQGACLDSLFFRCFQFRLTLESIEELGSVSAKVMLNGANARGDVVAYAKPPHDVLTHLLL